MKNLIDAPQFQGGIEEKLTDKQKRSQSMEQALPLEPGVYMLLSQKHHGVKVPNAERLSKRHVLVGLDNNKPVAVREISINAYTNSVTRTIDKAEEVDEIEPRKMEIDGVEVNRLPQRFGSTRGMTGVLPKSVVDDYLVITEPCLIQVNGPLKGVSPEYVEKERGIWDMKLDKKGYVQFVASEITSFEVLEKRPTDKQVEAAKSFLKEASGYNYLFDNGYIL